MNPVSSARAFANRFVLALVISTAFAGIGIGSSYWIADRKLDDAARVDVELDEQQRGEPANFLIIGSDTRAFVEGGLDAEHFGDADETGGQRSDTIMIAHIDPDTESGLLVSFPRDLWVDIPEFGESKLNAAFNGGPQRVVDTIKSNFDVKVHHYIEINFNGFRNLVDAIGSVPIFFPTPARDVKSGLFIDTAGCRDLDGDMALNYVRSRQYESQDAGGDWHVDGTADLGRIRRQQYFMRSLAKTAIRAGFRDLTKINNILNKSIDNLSLDPKLGLSDLRALARTFREVDPEVVEMLTIPSRREFIDGQDAQVMIDEEAAPILARLRAFGEPPVAEADTVADIPPGEIGVAVRNGSGVSGQARVVFDGLADLGFATVEPPGNADHSDYEFTEVRFGPDDEEKARVVLANLGGAGQLVELNDSPSDAEILVVVGADFQQLGAPAVGADGEAFAVPAGLVAFAEGNVAAPARSVQSPSTALVTTVAPANPGGSPDQPFPVAGC
ncbi:MAG: LCP family protein [Actinomycetota bacterium]